MISVKRASRRYLTCQSWRTVLHDISFTLQKGERIGILGRNGAGKSTPTRFISGVGPPSRGEIRRTISISWPLAFSDAFQSSLTGIDNLRFICHIYNVDIDYVKDFTEEFSELGQYLYEPIKCYSSSMKVHLAFVLSLVVEFDYYLVDKVIAVDDSRFAGKYRCELFKGRKKRSIILVSHSYSAMKQYCDNAVVLGNGHMHTFEDMDKTCEYYNALT